MWRLLFPVLLLGLVLLFEPATAQAAKRITLQNDTGYTASAVVVVQTNNGWRVHGWYRIAPYSYRTINFSTAGGRQFGFYAYVPNTRLLWSGKNNDPTITVVNNAMNHDVRQAPYGNNQRRVKVRMVNGNSYRFYQAAQQQQRQTGWW